MILLHSGKFAEATKLFTSNKSWAVPRSTSRPSLLTTEFLGDVHLEQGQAAAALACYDEVFPKAMALVPKGDIIAELRRRRAECYLLLGRHAEAYAEAKVGLDHCRDLGDRYEEAATYRVLGLAAAAVGRPEEAKRWFEQGFAYYDDIETPYEWGKLWLAYGDWLNGEAAGAFADPQGAGDAYRAAADHFERMGSQARHAEACSRLTAIGEGATDSSVTSPAPADPVTGGAKPRPARRPRVTHELAAKARWAREMFGVVTESAQVVQVLEDAAKLARGKAPILLLGESGTGKELVARGIHRLSGRRGNFVPINAGALPREIIESELFGYMPGAFTGATREKPGLFEVANDGTVFLDEIGEMSLELQTRLLRLMETGEVRRLGATRDMVVRTRVVAATNKDAEALEHGAGFRSDLYYRLAHAVLTLPPLRQRGGDVALLVDHFLGEACAEEGTEVRLSAGARARLAAYGWPGNVRQMGSLMRRIVALAPPGHVVEARDLPLDERSAPGTLIEELADAERRRVRAALDQAHGSRSDAARILGIPRTTLLHKIRRFGLE